MTTINQPDQSPAPGIVPGPAHFHHSNAPPGDPHGRPERSQSFVRAAIAKLASALRGDKYMVGAYPAAGSEDPGTPVAGGTNDGER
jgi:hypothetical protein